MDGGVRDREISGMKVVSAQCPPMLEMGNLTLEGIVVEEIREMAPCLDMMIAETKYAVY